MDYSLVWLEPALLEAGLKVAALPGWRGRGRGDMGLVRGVICHHTAGPRQGNMPSLGVVTEGRRGLPGPLANLCLGRDGTFYLVAAGRANHAGRGRWAQTESGNSRFIGIEAENTGQADDPWPPVQIDAYARGVAAILRRLGTAPEMCCGHKEFATPRGRKSDPSFDMDDFRDLVAHHLVGINAAPPLIPAKDAQGRLTQRRGGEAPTVAEIQAKVGAADTGVFDAQTEAAVRQFQRSKGLIPDGIVGPKTWTAMDEA